MSRHLFCPCVEDILSLTTRKGKKKNKLGIRRHKEFALVRFNYLHSFPYTPFTPPHWQTEPLFPSVWQNRTAFNAYWTKLLPYIHMHTHVHTPIWLPTPLCQDAKELHHLPFYRSKDRISWGPWKLSDEQPLGSDVIDTSSWNNLETKANL